MYILIVIAFTLIAAWYIFKVARKRWYDAVADEVNFKVKETREVYESVRGINPDRVKKQHDKIEETKEAIDL